MKFLRHIVPLLLFASPFLSNGQLDEVVTWEYRAEQLNDTVYQLQFQATIAPKWHMYSQFSPEDGAVPTEFQFDEQPQAFVRLGEVTESESITAYDKVFEMDLIYFDSEAQFFQKVWVKDKMQPIQGTIIFQACDDKLCIFREEAFTFRLTENALSGPEKQLSEADSEKAKALQLQLKNTQLLSSATAGQDGNGAYFNIFLLGLLGGFLALLTPCVFPMIPLTVSFFLKQSDNRKKGVFQAIMYGVFIVLIYGLLSMPFHFLDSLDPEILNTISTNVVLNFFFFVVFLFFAFSFFGYYELSLPSSWGANTDAASQWKGLIGVFFMALTLAIVSFSCTGPILGSLLASSISSSGGAWQLTAGMMGFGVALGLPFALFALFPTTLDALPKSGGWLNTLKVVLGFIELGLALKFLSNADLVAHWGLLKREVFVGLWFLISFLTTLYLFGFIRFPHDGPKSKLGGVRLGFGGLMLLFSAYLFLGLISEENRLKALSGFPPPEFYSIHAVESECPLNLNCYKDFATGLAAAQAAQKPILLDFTGWACVNCRKMEENVWSAPKVYTLLKDEYILISLYVDDRKELSAEDAFQFQLPDGRIKDIKTIGQKWATFQALNFQTASQPYYVLMAADGTLLNSPIQYTDTQTYLKWLEDGLAIFRQ
ncbi:MAG: cytochrome c biogenesis protein CcdA [Flavobacteriaceae bacterium]